MLRAATTATAAHARLALLLSLHLMTYTVNPELQSSEPETYTWALDSKHQTVNPKTVDLELLF